MLSIKEFFQIMKGISENKSLCRILQNIECQKVSISGNIIEFGAEPSSKNNFSKIAINKKIKNLHFSDKHLKKSNVINADLNKKNIYKKKIYMTIFFYSTSWSI